MKLSKHVLRGVGFVVVVFQALVLCDVTNGVKRGGAEFTRSLGNIVRHIKDLLCVFIEQNKVTEASADGGELCALAAIVSLGLGISKTR